MYIYIATCFKTPPVEKDPFFSIDRIKVVIGVILEQLDRMGESMVGMSCVRISKTFSAHDQNHC